MQSDYYINLHFNQAVAQRTGYAFKIGDKGCTFHFHCEDLDPSGMYPHIVFNHPNNTCVEGVPTGSGRDYAYTIQGNEFAVIGKTVVDLKFYDALDATQRISTASFIIEILPDTYTDFLAPSSPYADSLETAKEELEDAEQDLTDMDALFAQTLQDYIDAFGNTAPINPRGAYDPNELYKPRDAVYFTSGGKTITYLNNLECTGVDPTNTSNWQPIIDITGIPAIIDNCNSTSTTDALAANQGRVLADNLAANEKNGAKNLSNQTFTSQTIDVVSHTPNADGSLTVTTNGAPTTTAVISVISTSFIVEKGTYIFSFEKDSDEPTTSLYAIIVRDSSNTYVCDSTQTNAQRTVTFAQDTTIHYECYCGANNVVSDVTFYPMIRDARVIDPTFAPYAETNLQLTQNKADRDDLATIHATGSTNTTGAQIDKDALFYLNGTLCKALTNIAANATFTLNTNYKLDTVNDELLKVRVIEYNGSAADDKTFFTDVINHVISLYGGSGQNLQFIVGGLKQSSYYYKGIGYGYFGGGVNDYVSLQCSSYISVFLIATGGGTIQIRQIDGTLI